MKDTATAVNVSLRSLMGNRECGACTKCCEGYCDGEVFGIPFHKGRPCHFVDIDKGCTIYESRPEEPCKKFKCGWLSDENIPLWMKPDLINAIVHSGTINGMQYFALREAGRQMNPRVLSWMFMYCSINKFNLLWEVDGGWNAVGSTKFVEEFYKPKNQQPQETNG